MKKVLLTSTALVAFTGAAAADVALSGRAEMGIFDTNAAGVGAQFFTDIDVTFTMTGETDNGLTFGASVDLDEGGASTTTTLNEVVLGADLNGDGDSTDTAVNVSTANPATGNNADDGGATIFISGAFGTVTMGDTDGALDWALTEAGNVGNPGSLADDETAHAGYMGSYLDGGNDGQILRWDYTSGAFGVAVSLEDDNGSNAANSNIGYAIGLRYALDITGGTITFGLGHQRAADAAGVANDSKATGVSISGAFDNGLSAGVTYTDIKNNAADSHYSIGLGYTSGAISVHANYGKFKDNSAIAGLADGSGYGLAAAYDLGGGAVIHAGFGSGKSSSGAPRIKTASFGLALSF